jgi:hypothetical protein
MRGRLIGALAAGAALVAAAVVEGPVAAQPAATWTVTPGGPFHGEAGETILTIEESGVQLFCVSSSVDGTAKSGSGVSNPLAEIPQSPGIQFNDCQGPFGLTFTVTHVGTWYLNGVSYNAATGVTQGTIDNITANIVGPGCNATVTGSVNGRYTNSTDVLQVLPDYTLEITYVDPANDCLGLINVGEHSSFDGSYQVTPNLTITSP